MRVSPRCLKKVNKDIQPSKVYCVQFGPKQHWVLCCRRGSSPVPHMASNEDRRPHQGVFLKKVALLLTVSTETILPA
jgi:hypothetical protein